MSLGGLEPALPVDDPLAVVVLGARPEEALEDGRLGLLGLEEERVVAVAAVEQRDEREQPDAADADDLHRRVDQGVAVEQDPPVLLDASRGTGRAPSSASARVSPAGWVMIGGWSTIRRDPSSTSVSLGSSWSASWCAADLMVVSR